VAQIYTVFLHEIISLKNENLFQVPVQFICHKKRDKSDHLIEKF